MKKISIIGDEISDNIREVVEFLKKHKGRYVELRTINKKNILDFSLLELKKYANYLKESNIRVSCIASPILKWYPNNIKIMKYDNLKVDSFYFNGTHDESYSKAFEAADIFNAPYIRIFSFLKYKNFRMEHLDFEIKTLIDLAKKHDKILLIENEPSCNLNTVDDIYNLIKRFNVSNLKILLDIGNLYKEGNRLKDNELLKIKDLIRYIHVKDYSFSMGRYTILGDGDINYKKHISLINTIATNTPFYSLETHVGKDNKYNHSSISFYKLKEILSNLRVKYCIVGCGRVFKKHILAIKEDKSSELVGVFDIDKKKMLKEAKNNDCLYYDSLSDLTSDVDVVNICTPHYTHTKIINKVLESGKKCICEKPGCMNKEDAKKIIANRVYKDNVFVVYQNRFNKPVLELEKIIKDNKLGDLLYVFGNVRWFRERSYYLNSWQGKRNLEGGILFNQGIHIIDIIMRSFKLGEKTKIINSFKDKIYHKNIDTEDLFLMQFKSGKTVYNLEITVSVLPCNLESGILFIFEKGRIRIGGLSLNEFLSVHIEGKDAKNLRYHENSGKDVYGYGHKVLIKKFSEYVLSGIRDKNLVDFEEAYERIKFINKLYRMADK